MPLSAIVVHRLPGRLRLRLPELRNDAKALVKLVERLQGIPGILAVEANVVTGGLLLHYEGREEEILQMAAVVGEFQCAVAESLRPDLRGRLEQGMRNLNQTLQAVTGGEVDLNGLLVVGLTIMAIQQAMEGNVMVPAAALLWNAYQASRMPPLDARQMAQGEPAAPAVTPSHAPVKGVRHQNVAAKAFAGKPGSKRSHRKGDTR